MITKCQIYNSLYKSKHRYMMMMSAKGFGFTAPKFAYTGKVQAGKQSPKSIVPEHINKPDYALDGIPKNKKNNVPWDIAPCAPEDIVRMRVAGKIAREVLDAAVRLVKVGITTGSTNKQLNYFMLY